MALLLPLALPAPPNQHLDSRSSTTTDRLPLPTFFRQELSSTSYLTLAMEDERLISAGCRAFLPDDNYSTHPHYYRDCLLLTRLGSSAATAISVILIVLVGFHRFVLKGLLLPAVYGPRYTNLDTRHQRHFSMHHLKLVVCSVSVPCIVKPLFLAALKGSHWSDPYSPGWEVTLGDVASIAVYLVSALMMFELLHVDDLKLLFVLHHIGTIMMVQGFLFMAYSLPAGDLVRISDSKTIADIALFWSKWTCLSFVILCIRF